MPFNGENVFFCNEFQAITSRSIYSKAFDQRCSVREVFLEVFAIFIGKHLCRSFFFSKVSGLGLQHKPFLLSGDCFCLFSCSMFRDNLIQSLLILSPVKLITSLAHIIWNPDVACGVLILFFAAAKVRCGLIFFAYSQAS